MWATGLPDSVPHMIGRRALVVWVSVVVAVFVGGAAAGAQEAAPAATAFGDVPGALRLPEAVAVAPNGDLLVGDHFSGRVQRFRDGGFVGSFGLRGEGCGRLGAIGGVAVDAKGNTYVLDTDQQLVQVFDAADASVRCFGGKGRGVGKLSTTSGSYAASSASGGIAVAGDTVYVADTGNDRVQRFSLTGGRPKSLEAGKLKQPQGLAVQGTRLLVADDGNHRVVELTTSGRFVAATSEAKGVRLKFPYDVAFTESGGAYVADNSFHRVVQLDRHLRRVRTWGSQGHGRGKFVFPRAVAVQRDGHVLVADAGNDRVQELTATGGFVRSIGINGRATPRITAPADVAVNALGEVAVADGNGRLSWFDLAGRFQGAWAQSRSFQQSTAVVTQPQAVDFGTDRSLRVVDSGDVRVFADDAVTPLSDSTHGASAPTTSLDVGPTGTLWAVQGKGLFARLAEGAEAGGPADAGGTKSAGAPKPTWFGTAGAAGRTTTAIAELADGSVAIAEGTSPHQVRPADGTISRHDAAGRLLATWPVPRPAGGQPSRPGGLAATVDGGLWVSDTANDRLLRLAPDGTIAETLGTPGLGAGELAGPRGLELDCAGGLLVADSGNNRIVRFATAAGGRAGTTCAAAGTPTAAGRPPGIVGLKVRTKSRPKRPHARLGSITATCRRTCTLKADRPSISVLGGRAGLTSYPAQATIAGSTITLRASAKAVKAMRVGVAKGQLVSAGVVITATAADGVVDTASIVWSFR
jgi:tripartite motif-containing protein 71